MQSKIEIDFNTDLSIEIFPIFMNGSPPFPAIIIFYNDEMIPST